MRLDLLYLARSTYENVKLNRLKRFLTLIHVDDLDSNLNPSSANPTKWSNTLDELFQCIWQFCGIGA